MKRHQIPPPGYIYIYFPTRSLNRFFILQKGSYIIGRYGHIGDELWTVLQIIVSYLISKIICQILLQVEVIMIPCWFWEELYRQVGLIWNPWMVSFDLSFISMLIEEIVEDEGAIWTEGRILCLYINRNYYQGNMLQVVYGVFCSCVRVSLGAAFWSYGCFFKILIKQKWKTKTRTACRHTSFLRLIIWISN